MGHVDKTCSRCQRWLPLTDYHKDKYKASGHKGTCKDCTQQSYREGYRRRMADPEKRRAYNLRQLAWRAANAEEVREKARRRGRAPRREYMAEYGKRHRHDHPLRYAQRGAKYRAVKNGCYAESVDLVEMFDLFGSACYICNQLIHPDQFELDHVIPISRGGPHIVENLRPVHYRCNMRKFNHVVSFFERLIAERNGREAAA